jgi:hypothetical protein
MGFNVKYILDQTRKIGYIDIDGVKSHWLGVVANY